MWFLLQRRAHSELCNQSCNKKHGQTGKKDWYFNKCLIPKEVVIILSTQQYSIRTSSRAKYMRLSVSLDKGVEVIVPGSMSQHLRNQFIPQFVRDKQQWITNALEKLQKKNADKKTIAQCALPDTIVLAAIEQSFNVHYLPDKSNPVLYCKNNEQLEIRANINDKAQVFSLLEDFFKDYAKPYLQQKCEQHSRETGLRYNRLTIRAQKTRWGSCSAKKNISLNYRLLFLQEELVDYIILHELAHTRHMNHSRAFWNFLETLLPDARSLDKQVNQTANSLPSWIYYKQLALE